MVCPKDFLPGLYICYSLNTSSGTLRYIPRKCFPVDANDIFMRNVYRMVIEEKRNERKASGWFQNTGDVKKRAMKIGNK